MTESTETQNQNAPLRKIESVGILTAGGDCPGLNAAIRGIAKTLLQNGVKIFGIQDGFRGLVENRIVPLEDKDFSNILTLGGTILGSSRDKPRKMQIGDKVMDMQEVAAANLRKAHIDVLVCLGGNGTQKNAMLLHKNTGIDVLTLPKTIDNDVAGTDISFGFDTALGIATEAIDRLHTTATSHHRVIVCEIMGHKAGWLALGAGLAGGADVILIPEIPYQLDAVIEHIKKRRRNHKRFSIVAIAEGAISQEEKVALEKMGIKKRKSTQHVAEDGTVLISEDTATRVAREIEQASGIECRVTSLGHVQRGGTPSAGDRLLCTRLGAKAAELLLEGSFNVMVGIEGTECVPVELDKVSGITRDVPADHAWIQAAKDVGTCMGV